MGASARLALPPASESGRILVTYMFLINIILFNHRIYVNTDILKPRLLLLEESAPAHTHTHHISEISFLFSSFNNFIHVDAKLQSFLLPLLSLISPPSPIETVFFLNRHFSYLYIVNVCEFNWGCLGEHR